MGEALKVKYYNGSGGVIKDGPGRLFGYIVNVAAASIQLKLFDNTTSSGDVLARIAISNSNEKCRGILFRGHWIEFSNLFAEFNGSAASTACIYYK